MAGIAKGVSRIILANEEVAALKVSESLMSCWRLPDSIVVVCLRVGMLRCPWSEPHHHHHYYHHHHHHEVTEWD